MGLIPLAVVEMIKMHRHSVVDAAWKGDYTRVRTILSRSPGLVDTRDEDGGTALMYVVEKGNLYEAEFLIGKGADVNARNKRGKTALMFAAEAFWITPHMSGRYENIADYLIMKGADVNAKDEFGRTALKMALDDSHNSLADLLRKKGAKK